MNIIDLSLKKIVRFIIWICITIIGLIALEYFWGLLLQIGIVQPKHAYAGKRLILIGVSLLLTIFFWIQKRNALKK